MNEIENEDDGLLTPLVGSWAETKYNLVANYNSLFSTGMKNLWDQRIYLDLYCGAGKSRIRTNNKTVKSSALLALNVKYPFDKHIFCDIEKENLDELKSRIVQNYSWAEVKFIHGDCNEKIDEILREIPDYSNGNKVLSFCFLDPFSLKMDFETIKKLSEKRKIDFLILLAFGMDGKRNIGLYLDENHDRIDRFLGLNDWRKRWQIAEQKHTNLVKFLADEFTNQMIKLGYLDEAIDNFISIHSDEKNLPLYYLAFFSKHPRGYDFWKKVKNISTEPELGF